MANEAVEGLQYIKCVITSLDGETVVDISNIIIHADYYEDILSPCTTMKLLVMNTTSLYNFLPVRGGERLDYAIQTASGIFEIGYMYVFKVSNIDPKDTNELFTMHFVSREGLTNETTRCLRKYTGNLKPTVEKILREDLKTERFLPENIEQTANSYSFIGNTRKPFRVLTWLGTKANPIGSGGEGAGGVSGDGSESGEAKGTAGFFFWENKEGFNFKSIESLVSNTQIGSGSADNSEIPKYFFSGATGYDDALSAFRILNYDIKKNIDLLKALRVGMYANKTYFYDYYDGICRVYIYKLKEQIQNTLGTDNDIALSDEFGDSWTRLMVRIADTGVLDNTEEISTPSGRDNADMAKAAARYNLLFTQALNMVVPCNINLKAGDIIYCEFPAIQLSNSKIDEEQSGNYLISQVRHHFEGTQMISSLNLIRDSYGVYGKEETN